MGRRAWIAVLVVALAAGACKSSDDGDAVKSTGSGTRTETLKLGAALSLTGGLAREGVLTREGYDYCKTVVNDKGGVKVGDVTYQLDIAYQDDTSKADVAGQLVSQFNDEGIKFVLGPYGSASTEAAAAVIERNGQVMLDSAGADDNIFTKGYRNTFAVLSPASLYVTSMVKAIADLAKPTPKTLAIISADDGFSKTAAEAGKTEAEKRGMQVVALEFVKSQTSDVSPALTKIRELKPDVILVSAHLVEGVAAIKQSKELGVLPLGFGETVAPPTPDFVKNLGPDANGVLGSSQWTPDVEGKDKYFGTAQDYATGFEKAFHKPEYHNAEASAACLALVLGIEKAQSVEPAKVRDAVASLDAPSFFGPLKFDATGKNVTKEMVVIQIQNGEGVTVWPVSSTTKPLKWPATTG